MIVNIDIEVWWNKFDLNLIKFAINKKNLGIIEYELENYWIFCGDLGM